MADSPPFPLDAEQIVRLTTAVVWELREAVRPAAAKPVPYIAVLARFSDAAGVSLIEVDAARAEHDSDVYGVGHPNWRQRGAESETR